jgi:hypothetical protein
MLLDMIADEDESSKWNFGVNMFLGVTLHLEQDILCPLKNSFVI